MSQTPRPYARRAYYYETDQMGIAHHSNYFRWMEEARLDFMRQADMDYAQIEKAGIIMPVTQVSCDFRVSVRFDQIFTIRVMLASFNGIRAGFRYEIFAEGCDRPAATGESGHCFLDALKRTPVNMKKKNPDFYRKCLALVNAGGLCREAPEKE